MANEETTTTQTAQPITVKDLLDAGLHFGHQTRRWNPKMKRYIFDKRNGIHVIDLSQTHAGLTKALEFLQATVASGRSVLFVGTKKQAQQSIKEVATRCNQPYVTHRWLGGTLTNNAAIRRSVKQLLTLEDMEKTGTLDKMHKKEASRARHDLEKLRRHVGGVVGMAQLPGALFIVDVNREANAVKEANTLKIPVVAIVDTNCDPDPIDYVIPGNDDAIRGIKLISTAIGDTVSTAVAEALRVAAEQARRRELAEMEARARQQAAAQAAAEANRQRAAEAAKQKAAAQAAAQAAAPAGAEAAAPEAAASEESKAKRKPRKKAADATPAPEATEATPKPEAPAAG